MARGNAYYSDGDEEGLNDEVDEEDALILKHQSQQQVLLSKVREMEKTLLKASKNLLSVCEGIISQATQLSVKVEEVMELSRLQNSKGEEDIEEKLQSLGSLKNKMNTYFRDHVKALIMETRRIQALRNVKHDIEQWDFRTDPHNVPELNVESLLTKYLAAEGHDISEDELDKHDLVKSWKQQVPGMNINEDDEITALPGADVSLKCSITMQPMVRPVQSKVCKHVFSEQGIDGLFRKGMVKPCPQAGCSKRLKRSDFVYSEELEARVIAARKRQERKEQATLASQVSQAVE